VPRLSAGFFFLFLLALQVSGQDQPFRISVDVPDVTVDAIVRDQSGRVLTDLEKADFEIYEDGQPQNIVYFATAETPRSILLLFDVSGSTDAERPFMVEAVNVFLANMRPHDRISLASFAGEVHVLMNWRDREGKSQAIQMPAPQFSSNVYTSLESAVARFKNENGRKGMIVMTDGRDTTMYNDIIHNRAIRDIDKDSYFRKVMQNLQKQGVPLYFIAMNTDRNPASLQADYEVIGVQAALGKQAAQEYLIAVRKRMERLAEATNGRILYPKTLEEVAPLYDLIARELGVSYSIGYSPGNHQKDGSTRRIDLRVKREGAKITQSRDSYVAR